MATPPRGYTPLPGSERTPLARARLTGAADPNESLLVTVRVRPRNTTAGLAAALKTAADPRPGDRRYMTREEFTAAHGADPADLGKIEEFAHAHGLTVAENNAAERSVKLLGTVAAFSAAFGVDLSRYEYSGGSYRGRTGPIHVPEDLAPIIEGVFGLDDRPQARAHFRRSAPVGVVRPRTGGGTSYTPPQLAKLYSFPTAVTGRGQCIAIIELGGGYRAADLKTYFTGLGIKPLPKVRSKSVDGGHNRPTSPDSADGEVMLDVEVAGGVAPGAEIVVYFAPNTDAGFLDAVRAAIHDQRHQPSVISISWGAAERFWTTQAMRDMDQAFQEAAALGVTVCCAAGDDGSSDLRGGSDGSLHVDFPASSPYALACGGTRLDANGTIAKEVVWNEGQSGGATGGGISDVFDLPSWQKAAKVPASANPGGRIGRGVPDVAGDADPQTGYQVLVDGQEMVIGGTSAVAPLWAGLVALMNEGLGHRAGYLNPVLYGLPTTARAFRDIAVGNNDTTGNGGAYPARRGWDACTGLGSPVGKKLLAALGHA